MLDIYWRFSVLPASGYCQHLGLSKLFFVLIFFILLHALKNIHANRAQLIGMYIVQHKISIFFLGIRNC